MNYFIATDHHVRIILDALAMLRVRPSHLLLLSHRGSGSKTLMKITAQLAALKFYEVSTTKYDEFIGECLNTIKAGGRKDEVLCYVGGTELEGGISRGPQYSLMEVLQSLICSPELYEFLGEDRIE